MHSILLNYFFVSRKTKYKDIVVHLQFPKDYPRSCILVELKSKTIPDKLLNKLVGVCDVEMKQYIDKQQVKYKQKQLPLYCVRGTVKNIVFSHMRFIHLR